MNRDMLIKAFIFTAGAAIGSVVTWKVIKTKYEQISNEEIESVREEYRRLTKIMRMEIDACRKATAAHTKDEASANEDSTDEDRYVTIDSDDADDYSESSTKQVKNAISGVDIQANIAKTLKVRFNSNLKYSLCIDSD